MKSMAYEFKSGNVSWFNVSWTSYLIEIIDVIANIIDMAPLTIWWPIPAWLELAGAQNQRQGAPVMVAAGRGPAPRIGQALPVGGSPAHVSDYLATFGKIRKISKQKKGSGGKGMTSPVGCGFGSMGILSSE